MQPLSEEGSSIAVFLVPVVPDVPVFLNRLFCGYHIFLAFNRWMTCGTITTARLTVIDEKPVRSDRAVLMAFDLYDG